MTDKAASPVLAESIATYVESHERYDQMTKREAVVEAVTVLLTDQGAAQSFIDALGLDVDLYDLSTSDNTEDPVTA